MQAIKNNGRIEKSIIINEEATVRAHTAWATLKGKQVAPYLVENDTQAMRQELIDAGIDVSDITEDAITAKAMRIVEQWINESVADFEKA